MDNPIRECLEHERNVAKADVEFALDDDARFWAEKRLAKFTELLEQYDELLAYVRLLEATLNSRSASAANTAKEFRPEFLQPDAVSCSQTDKGVSDGD